MRKMKKTKSWKAPPVRTPAPTLMMMCNCNVGAISIGLFTLSDLLKEGKPSADVQVT